MANCVDLGLLEKSNDGGHACGVGQVHVDLLPTLLPKSMTCEALRADRRLGFEAALLVFQHLVKTCGTMRGAMNAYATGKCPGKSGAVIPLVAKRCKIIGC